MVLYWHQILNIAQLTFAHAYFFYVFILFLNVCSRWDFGAPGAMASAMNDATRACILQHFAKVPVRIFGDLEIDMWTKIAFKILQVVK